LAERFGIDPATVRRDAGFKEALDRVAVSYYRGLEYLEEKRPVGANQYTERGSQNAPPSKTADVFASRHGVDRATIHRDARFAEALDRVAEIVGGRNERGA
jgi:DeoR/GlpR family transcriptional regulator of sugar metabolism